MRCRSTLRLGPFRSLRADVAADATHEPASAHDTSEMEPFGTARLGVCVAASIPRYHYPAGPSHFAAPTMLSPQGLAKKGRPAASLVQG